MTGSGSGRVLLVGQAPSRATDGGPAFSGRSGARIAELAGIANLADVFEPVNLFDRYPGKLGKGDRFPLAEARQRAAALELPALTILVGGNVARAFYAHHLPLLTWFPWPIGYRRASLLAVIPHPSGVNRFWNHPGHTADAARFLRLVVASANGRLRPPK